MRARSSRLERHPLAARRHVARAAPHHRAPAERRELRRLLANEQHAVAIGDRNHEVDHGQRLDAIEQVDLDHRLRLPELHDVAVADTARAVDEAQPIADRDAAHARVMRFALARASSRGPATIGSDAKNVATAVRSRCSTTLPREVRIPESSHPAASDREQMLALRHENAADHRLAARGKRALHDR